MAESSQYNAVMHADLPSAAAPAPAATLGPAMRSSRRRSAASRYVTLVATLARSDFKLRFAHSNLGYIWTVSKPLMLFGVMYVVFSELLRFGEGIQYYPVILLMGLMLWGFFAEATSGAVTVLVSRADLIRKASFPRSALPVSVTLTSLMVFAFNFLTLFVFVFAAGVPMQAEWLLFAALVLELVVLGVGVSLMLSASFVYLRDIGQVWAVLLQALFYATPVIYPIETLDMQGADPMWKSIILMNPIAQIIQDGRWALVGGDTESTAEILGTPLLLVPYSLTALSLALGLLMYRKFAVRLSEHV